MAKARNKRWIYASLVSASNVSTLLALYEGISHRSEFEDLVFFFSELHNGASILCTLIIYLLITDTIDLGP